MLLALILATASWHPIAPGVEHRVFELSGSELHAVRIDPATAELGFGLRSREGGNTRTAAEWARQRGFSVAINAGMFQTDYVANVGKLVDGAHVNAPKLNHYQSLLVFGPKDPKAKLPRAQLIDLDAPGAAELAEKYAAQVQNLRLVKAPGVNLWKPNGRRWSEAAIAQDADGRILFLFSRAGLEMSAWNDALLKLPLKVVKAMHVEGGPEASLSIHGGGVDLDLCGSYETGFFDDGNAKQWPLPNVVGVRKAPP